MREVVRENPFHEVLRFGRQANTHQPSISRICFAHDKPILLQGIDYAGHRGTRYSCLFGKFGGSRWRDVARPAEEHQHHEAALADSVTCKKIGFPPENGVTCPEQMQKGFQSARIEARKAFGGL